MEAAPAQGAARVAAEEAAAMAAAAMAAAVVEVNKEGFAMEQAVWS